MKSVQTTPPSQEEEQAHKFFRRAGTAYGLVSGLGFALLIWGRDTLMLTANHAHLPWANLLLGLPISIILCILTSRLASASPSAGVHVALGTVTGVVMGIIAGHMPFEGKSLIVWLMDRRLWGLAIYPFGPSAAARTTLVTLVTGFVGTIIGFLEHLALEWAWDHSTPGGRLSFLSWISLLVSVPPILLAMGTTEGMINGPMRNPQWATGELVQLALEGKEEEATYRDLGYRSITPHLENLSDDYTVYLVEYDVDFLYMFYTDVRFDNGFHMRCTTAETRVLYCEDFSDNLSGWMDDLVHYGIFGVQRWSEEEIQHLRVDSSVLSWLDAHKEQLSESYETTVEDQQGGWIFMTARFATGFEMTCRFHEMEPVHVDRCYEIGEAGQ